MKYTNDTFLANNTRPSHTGQGLTTKQMEFFKTPKSMEETAKELFNGDYWEANRFQNKFIGEGVLTLNQNGTIELLEY